MTNKDVAQNKDKENDEEGGEKTRKKSDKNMNNYRKIVIADDSEAEQRYTSDYRGRVQDKNVNITLEPMFALTYYTLWGTPQGHRRDCSLAQPFVRKPAG